MSGNWKLSSSSFNQVKDFVLLSVPKFVLTLLTYIWVNPVFHKARFDKVSKNK